MGFRKIDTDRWEFACEGFLRGKKHFLKNIRRRKSLQSNNEEGSTLSGEAVVERLHKEKIEMMQEVIKLQQQQNGTHQYMESVNKKLQAVEDRQKQMVSSLAKAVQIPPFYDRKRKEQGRISSPRTELAQVEDPLRKEESVFNLDFEAKSECYMSSPVNLAKENTKLELFSPGSDDCMVKQEEIWSSDFDTVAAMPVSSNEMWSDVGNCELPEFGVGGGELSDFWNLAASGAANWQSDETSQSRDTNQYGF